MDPDALKRTAFFAWSSAPDLGLAFLGQQSLVATFRRIEWSKKTGGNPGGDQSVRVGPENKDTFRETGTRMMTIIRRIARVILSWILKKI